MSAAFSAVFGTPMAAAVFSMEVVSVGIMYYAALVPCVIASIIASKFAAGFGINPESFHVVNIPELTIEQDSRWFLLPLPVLPSVLFSVWHFRVSANFMRNF